MKNHAHDSIGCCCSDKVHQEIMNRFFIAEEKTDQLIEFYKRKIVDSIDTDRTEDRLTVFNLLPYAREEVVTTTVITKLKSFTLKDENGKEFPFEVLDQEIMDPGLIDRQIVHYGNYDPFIKYTVQFKDTLRPMGYQTYFVVEAEQEMTHSIIEKEKVETEFYEIEVNENGTLNIHDKILDKTFTNCLLLENGGDDGDEYDYSPLPSEELIYSDNVEAKVAIHQNDYEAKIDIEYTLDVPKHLENRKENVIDSSVDVKVTVTIPNDKAILHVQFEVDNHAHDHRLRALIPTGIASSFSVADNQFGYIARPVRDEAMDVWEKEDWDERPDAIYPMLTFTGLSNEEYGVSVLTNSTREYEIVGENYDTIAITLFRGVGVLGKEELLRRPGRPSGIKLPTPDSQMVGKLMLDFAITTHAQSAVKANVARMAKQYLTPVQCYNKIPYNAMKLNAADIKTPASFSLFQETNANAVLSTLKKAEKSDQYVLRFYNATGEAVDASFALNATEVFEANLNEHPTKTITVENDKVTISVKKNEVKTLLWK